MNRNNLLSLHLFGFILLGLAFVSSAQAQVDQLNMATRVMAGRSVNYYYAKPGDITITVSIWGFVQRPGLYEVASSTDLVNLISLAGGPNTYAKMSDVQLVRTSKKEDGSYLRKEYHINLSKLTDLKENELKLQPGDVIYVNHTRWYTVKEVFSVASSLAILSTSIYYISRIISGR